MKKLTFCLLLSFQIILLSGQEIDIDSLLVIAKTSTTDTITLKTYYQIADTLFNQLPDSSMHYWQLGLAYIVRESKKEKTVSEKAFLDYFKSKFENEVAYYHMQKGNVDESVKLLKQSEHTLHKLLTENTFPKNQLLKYDLGQNYNLQGLIYRNQGDIAKALDYNHKSLKIREESGDLNGIAQSLNNLGLIYKNLKDYENALKYYERSLEIIKNNPDMSYEAGFCLMNIASIHRDLHQFKNAEENYTHALIYFEKGGYKSGIAFAFYNLAGLRKLNKKYNEALDLYLKSLKIREDINDRKSIVNTMVEIGLIYLEFKEVEKAVDVAKKAHKISLTLGFPEQLEKSSRLLKKIEVYKGNYKSAFEHQSTEFAMRDSVFNIQIKTESEKQYLRYEFEKKAAIDSIEYSKELEIITLQLAKGEAIKDRQRIIIYSFLLGFIFIMVFLIIIYRMYLQKKEANQQLKIQNEEIMQQKEEIMAQRDEIESQRDRLFLQNEDLDQKKQNITDSIQYAKQIQRAVLPNLHNLNSFPGNYFILFKPKDIVSGDFYWTWKIHHKTIVAIADCTGHGVPGAFMSMLGISFLNEIVGKLGITKPNEILDELRELVVNSLKQNEDVGGQKDGIELSILCMDSQTQTFEWAGANNHVYILRPGKCAEEEPSIDKQRIVQYETNHLIEIRGDSMPASYFVRMNPFANHLLDVRNGDRLYLFTDGFADQTGGPNGKKIMSSGLKQLLAKSFHLPLEEQKSALLIELENWIKNENADYEQIDDITILGLQI